MNKRCLIRVGVDAIYIFLHIPAEQFKPYIYKSRRSRHFIIRRPTDFFPPDL